MKIRSLQHLASFFICGATLFMTAAQDSGKKSDVVEGAGQSGGTNARQMATDFLSSSGLVRMKLIRCLHSHRLFE